MVQGYVSDQCIINKYRLLGSSDREPRLVSTCAKSPDTQIQKGNLLEVDVLTGEGSVDGREGVELVFKQVLVLGVKEAGASQYECVYKAR